MALSGSEYHLLAQLKLDKAQIQKQIDAINNKVITLKPKIAFDKKGVDSYVNQWNNAIKRMQATRPDVFKSEEVVKDLKILRSSIAEFKASGGEGIQDVKDKFDNLKVSVTQAGASIRKDGYDTITMLRLALKKIALWAVGTTVIYGSLRAFKDMVEVVKELDSSLVEMAKVSDLVGSDLEAFADEAFRVAEAVGKTGIEAINAVTQFKKAGYEINEALELGEIALVMTNIAEGISDVEEATSALIAVIRGYNLEAEDALHITDAVNEVSNTSAINFDDLAEGLRRTSGTLSQTNTEVEELMGLLTGGFESLRNIEMVSSGLIMISQRLRGIEENGEESVELMAKLQDEFQEIAGVDIQDANGQLRSTYDILSDMSRVWPTLTDQQRQYLGELAAGNRQVKVLNAILTNWENVEKATKSATESAGSAMRENEKYLDSIEGKVAKLDTAFQTLARDTINSDLVKSLIDLATKILGVVDSIGILNIAILTLLAHSIKELIIYIPMLQKAFVALTLGVATTEVALGGLAVAIAGIFAAGIVGGIVLIKKFSVSIEETRAEFVKLKNEYSNNKEQLSSLIAEYGELARKENKTFEDKRRLLDIQIILNENYDALAQGMNFYTDAIDGNTKAIEENIASQKKLQMQQDLQYLEDMKDQYEIAQKFLDEHEYGIMGEAGGYRDIISLTARERINYLQEAIALGKDNSGVLQEELDSLIEQTIAAENIIFEYEAIQIEIKQAATGEKARAEALKEVYSRLVAEKTLRQELLEDILNFKNVLGGIYEDMEAGAGKNAFGELVAEVYNLNTALEDGRIEATEFFDHLNDGLKDVDFNEMFKGDKGSAESFFSAITMQATQSITSISNDFDTGKITLDEYTSSLTKVGETFAIIGDYASVMGIDVSGVLGGISDGVAQLGNLQETNKLLEQDYYRVTEQGLKFGTDAFNEHMRMLADAAAETGEIFYDLSGNALSSSDEIYGFLTSAEGNMENFATQMAQRTGSSMQKVVNFVGEMLISLSDLIRNFEGKIDFTPNFEGMTEVPIELGGTIYRNLIAIPKMALDISGGDTGTSAAIADWAQATGEKFLNLELNLDAGVYLHGAKESKEATEDLASAIKEVDDAFAEQSKAAEEAEKAYQDLLKATIAMIKQKKEDEKQALQDQLDGYKKIIDARKRLLDQQKEERDYQNKTNKLNKEIGDIQNEISELQFDTTEEGRRRRLELMEELAEKQASLEDEQYDRSVEVQKDALDDEYDRFKESIDARIREIENYLSHTGAITAEAIAMLDNKSSSFYQNLINWNRMYGTGIDQDIVGAWDRAFTAMQNYAVSVDVAIQKTNQLTLAEQRASEARSLKGAGYSQQLSWRMRQYHDGGTVDGVPTGKSGEVFAKLMKGEFVSTTGMMNNFVNNTLPKIMGVNTVGGDVNVEMKFDVYGNVDKTVLPDIESMVTKVINKSMKMRGQTRNANAFSV